MRNNLSNPAHFVSGSLADSEIGKEIRYGLLFTSTSTLRPLILMSTLPFFPLSGTEGDGSTVVRVVVSQPTAANKMLPSTKARQSASRVGIKTSGLEFAIRTMHNPCQISGPTEN